MAVAITIVIVIITETVMIGEGAAKGHAMTKGEAKCRVIEAAGRMMEVMHDWFDLFMLTRTHTHTRVYTHALTYLCTHMHSHTSVSSHHIVYTHVFCRRQGKGQA